MKKRITITFKSLEPLLILYNQLTLENRSRYYNEYYEIFITQFYLTNNHRSFIEDNNAMGKFY